MKVIIVGRFPPPIDGQAVATQRLARLLDPDLDLECFDLGPADANVRHRAAPTPNRIRHFLTIRKSLRRKLSEDEHAHVLWTTVSPTILGHLRDRIVTIPAFRPSQKTIAVVHRGDFATLFHRILSRGSSRRLVDAVDRFVFLTNDLSQQCNSWIPCGKRTVIPNTIDRELEFSDGELAARRRKRRAGTRFRLLFVANMIVSKGYMDTLEAAAELLRAGRDIEIHFAGQWMSNDQRKDFYSRAEPFSDRVVHHGAVTSRRALHSLYASADAYVLPTYYETEAQPLTVIEALSAGLPVIATRHAGIPEMVTDGIEAYLVESRRPNEIARAAERLMRFDTWASMADRARARFLSTFSPQIVRDHWLTLLKDT